MAASLRERRLGTGPLLAEGAWGIASGIVVGGHGCGMKCVVCGNRLEDGVAGEEVRVGWVGGGHGSPGDPRWRAACPAGSPTRRTPCAAWHGANVSPPGQEAPARRPVPQVTGQRHQRQRLQGDSLRGADPRFLDSKEDRGAGDHREAVIQGAASDRTRTTGKIQVGFRRGEAMLQPSDPQTKIRSKTHTGHEPPSPSDGPASGTQIKPDQICWLG